MVDKQSSSLGNQGIGAETLGNKNSEARERTVPPDQDFKQAMQSGVPEYTGFGSKAYVEQQEKENQTTESGYLVYLGQDGELHKDNASVGIGEQTNKGYNAPQKVQFGEKNGFLKRSETTTRTFDKFEFIIDVLGKEMGIKMANEYAFIRNDGEFGMISENVAGPDEKLMMFDDMKKEVEGRFTEAEITDIKNTLDKIPQIMGKEQLKRAMTDEDIVVNLTMFPKAIEKLNLSNEDKSTILQDYVGMVYFDSLIGNADRNGANYGLVKGENSYRFAPLFDNATISQPGVESNEVLLNFIAMDRGETIKVLKQLFPVEVAAVEKRAAEADFDKVKILEQQFLTDEDQNWFDRQIWGGDVLENLDNNENDDSAEIAEKMREMKELLEKIELKKREIKEQLKSYYECRQTDENATLGGEASSILSGYEDRVEAILAQSASGDNFIENLLSRLGQDALDVVKIRIEESVGG